MLLTLDDLPVGFEQIPVDYSDIVNEGLGGEKWPIESAFIFFEPDDYQFVVGGTQLLQGRLDQVQFDAGVRRPEFMLEWVIQSMELSGILEEDVLPDLDDIGDASSGITVASEGTGEGLPMRLDLVAFRRHMVGAYVIVMYVDGENPVVQGGELARTFDERIIDVLLSSPGPEGGVPNTESGSYVGYSNAELRFAAEYPAGWETEVTDNRNPLTGEPLEGKVVVFGPPDAQPRQRGIQVTVLRVAGGRRLSPEELPTDEGYIEYVKEWAEMTPVEIVVEPSIIEVDGYKAVEFVTSGTEEYEPHGLIGNVAIIVVEDRMFYIDAGGHAQGQDEMRSIYEHFMATFDVLPLP